MNRAVSGQNRYFAILSLLLMTLSLLGHSGCSLGSFRGSADSSAPPVPVVVEPLGNVEVIKQVAREIKPPGAEVSAENREETPLPSHTDSTSPFTMEVGQSFYEGSTLNLRLYLTAQETLPTADVAVEAVGLKDGVVVARDLAFLDKVVSTPVIAADQKVAVTLKLVDAEISEYQIRGMWGADARSKRGPSAVASNESTQARAALSSLPVVSAAEAKPPVTEVTPAEIPPAFSNDLLSNLVLKHLRVDRKTTVCDTPVCPERITVYGILENQGPIAAADVTLAVGLFWQEGELTPQLPIAGGALLASEREVVLSGQIILPGENKRLRLSIDREVPVVEGGKFIPHVRVLKASNAQ